MTRPPLSFKILENVDSTNNYAMAKVHEGVANHGDAFFAFSQTAGKGQREKSWYSGEHQNIALSIVLKPNPLTVSDQFYLTAIIALASLEIFSGHAGQNCKIKWPNDIYWCDRKAGGILIESVIRGNDWKWAVAGIGMNINQDSFTGDLTTAVSLKQVTGLEYDLVDFGREVHLRIINKLEALNSNSQMLILKEYNANLYKLNEMVELNYEGKILKGINRGVDASGKLNFQSGQVMRFQFGEVEWRI